MTDFTPFEQQLMAKLIRGAKRYKGHTFPNPVVGAAVYHNSHLISSGYHRIAGQDHAEVIALKKAGQAAFGASIMVTLSPCTHHGKTPPCVDAIIASGISRVVIAVLDTNPAVTQHDGISRLQSAGITVVTGLREGPARRVNAGYFKWMHTKRPRVHIKVGMSSDGIIAPDTTRTTMITGRDSLKHVHRIRRTMQAIIIGAGTACQDNPRLNIRYGLKRSAYKHPDRVVLDPTGRTPLDSHLFDPTTGGPLIICVSQRCNPEHKARLQHHATVWDIPETSSGLDWSYLLQKLGEHHCHDVLIEGGQAVFSSAIAADVVDEVHLFTAPCLMGSDHAVSAFCMGSFHSDHLRVPLYQPTYTQLGDDMYLNAVLKPDG